MKVMGILSVFLLVACSTKATSTSDAKSEAKTGTAVAAPSSGSATSSAPAASKTAKPTAVAAESSSGGEGKTTCLGADDSRILEITKEGEGCKLTYTKAGSTTNPANARNGTKFCEDVKAKIQAKLEQSGFKCN